jgi:S1-C subfamily serine protease
VESVEGLIGFLNSKQAGDQVTLTVVRGAETMELQVTLAAFPGG